MSRIEITIDGIKYTVLSDEDPQYVQKNAHLVDQGIEQIKGKSGYSSLSAAVLTAMNYADKYMKEVEVSDGLRRQLKEYAEECSRLRASIFKKKNNNSQ